MKSIAPTRQRCAIYTRKSTEHNLDLAFNSLDAQREACEAYIKSQAHEGWTPIPTGFDDGGLSGASLDRPTLQTLLGAVRAKQVDIIVVYKVDRLTRSLADFAKLVELFDQHGVSFVSVTQSFNTTSSMGRLTLNVFLSFAQFEREVIGERVRDKIAASKRKGIWVGGPVPLGYRSVDKKLDVVPEEAELVRKIFADYLRLGSIAALVTSLNEEGIRPKPRPLANGGTIAAERFQVGALAHLLKNRFYVGEVFFQNEVYPGSHEPIVGRELFDAVQDRLHDQAVARQKLRAKSAHILAGRLFDDRSNPMTPTHANKQGVRYRYYTSHALLQGRRVDAGTVARVSAPDLELLVSNVLRGRHVPEQASCTSDREIIDRDLVRAMIHSDRIVLTLSCSNPGEPPRIELPFALPLKPRKGVVHKRVATGTISDEDRRKLLSAIARSRRWADDLIAGRAENFEAIAQAEGMADRHVRFLAPLAFVAPTIVQSVVDGHAIAGLTVSELARNLPLSWAHQADRFGLL